MKDLKDILEASILDNAISEASLLDIDGTFEEGDKLENINLTSIFESKTRSEFETKFDVFRSMFKNSSEVHSIKPRNAYIAFVENKSMTRKNDMCNLSIYFGTNADLYRLTWTNFSIGSQMELKRIETFDLDYFMEKSVYLDTSVYVCPKNIKDEANKLIIRNLK